MNKTARGAAALAAAAALLLGGAGTYALWNDTESLDGGAVASGELKITGATAGVWRDVSGGGTGTVIADIASFLVVPGDTLTYTVGATVLAKGDNLSATLTADPTSVTGDPALLADVDVTTAVRVGGAVVPTITEANDGQTVQTVVTLAFDEASTNATQLQDLDLADLELVLQQSPR